MAKKDDAKKPGKSGKAKLRTPKTVAGVTLSREVRKAGDAALKVIEHPAISSIVAAGLLAAAASLTDDEQLRDAARAVEDEADEAAKAVGRAKSAAKAAAAAMGEAIVDEIKVAASGLGAR